ncbi:hypothetical protein HNO89_002996 [Sporosarcina luteola]|nr:hypothetical protein [Sporosarcina luteola]
MMRKRYAVTLKGSTDYSKFLGKLASSGMKIWSVSHEGSSVHFHTDPKGISLIRKNRRRFGVKAHFALIGEKSVESRLFSSYRFLVACIIPLVASLFLWSIEIDSDRPEVTERIEAKLLKSSIVTMKPLSSLPDEGEIRQLLMSDDPELSWVRFSRSGTRLTVIPMLSPKTDEREVEKGLPANLVARTGGVITNFQLSRGERAARVHQTVKKGDILATGILEQGDKKSVVGADGFVFADYWSEYNFTIPRKIDLQILGEETVEFTWRWPIQVVDNSYSFQSILKINRNREDLGYQVDLMEGMEETIILPLLKHKILSESSPSLTIKDENILQVSFEDDKVSGTILFLVNDNIAVKRPISQGD